MRILLVRHAEPDYSVDSLTARGWREAELLSRRLSRLKRVEGWFVSPLGRARDTAAATLRRVGAEAEALPWLQEFRGRAVDPDTGAPRLAWDFPPRTVERFPQMLRAEEWLDAPPFRGTNCRAVWEETRQGLEDLLGRFGYVRDGALWRIADNRRGVIVCFCHFGIAMTICAHLLGISPVALWQGLCMTPSSVTSLVTEERVRGEVWWRCEMMGDVSHLAVADMRPSTAAQFPEIYTGRDTTEPIEWDLDACESGKEKSSQ